MPSKILPFHPIFRPISSRVITQKLNYHLLGAPNLQKRLLLTLVRAQNQDPLRVTKYSTRRSGRDRTISGTSVSKILVGDKGELSDLNSNSFRKTNLYSDSDDERVGNEGFRNRERVREGGRGKDSSFVSRKGVSDGSKRVLSERRNENGVKGRHGGFVGEEQGSGYASLRGLMDGDDDNEDDKPILKLSQSSPASDSHLSESRLF